jgi:hypothetical protein
MNNNNNSVSAAKISALEDDNELLKRLSPEELARRIRLADDKEYETLSMEVQRRQIESRRKALSSIANNRENPGQSSVITSLSLKLDENDLAVQTIDSNGREQLMPISTKSLIMLAANQNVELGAQLATADTAEERRKAAKCYKENLSQRLEKLPLKDSLNKALEWISTQRNTSSGVDLLNVHGLTSADILDIRSPVILLARLIYEYINGNAKLRRSGLKGIFYQIFLSEEPTREQLTSLFNNISDMESMGGFSPRIFLESIANELMYLSLDGCKVRRNKLFYIMTQAERALERQTLIKSGAHEELFEDLPKFTVSILDALLDSDREIYDTVLQTLLEKRCIDPETGSFNINDIVGEAAAALEINPANIIKNTVALIMQGNGGNSISKGKGRLLLTDGGISNQEKKSEMVSGGNKNDILDEDI